ncbi:cupredoxin domain-containing protein [Patescibacteria group bacterium]|nr:cupredoxin domain-containing protein [Patescibacteria group bacterium]
MTFIIIRQKASLLLIGLLLAILVGPILTKPAQAAANVGDLVKCPDFSAIYYYAEDGKRYVFPHEKIFFSWYFNFDDVKTISCDDLATLRIGGNVTYQAGTRLIKIQSIPTVYAVEYGGVLREIQTENQASGLYGENWATLVDDLSEAFFPSYSLGDPLGLDEVPAGMVLEDDLGRLYRTQEDGTAHRIDVLISTGEATRLDGFQHPLSRVEDYHGAMITLVDVDASDTTRLTELRGQLKTARIAEEFIDETAGPILELGEEVMEEEKEAVLGLAEISIKDGSFFFSPSTITVKAGQEVQVTFVSHSGTHNFDIDEINLHETISQGKVITFTAPSTPGNYAFYCSVGSHRAFGMVGTLIVE